ncbi:hypothetical protein DFP72DRAFT_1171851 [Ephemerocybe angulata]|uniref:Uncharacterized protein n=1 Tax=Ephemerocybe angulata TaxID=980116 RepID=A0A8H6HSL5_9AGAR|nr:hypothetical protein DFP72DRAFT_1171851 [Tulosesus angulatus]
MHRKASSVSGPGGESSSVARVKSTALRVFRTIRPSRGEAASFGPPTVPQTTYIPIKSGDSRASEEDHIGKLPPELWLKIFRFAAEVSELTNSLQPDYANPRYRFKTNAQDVTKRSLLLVCRQWYHLATPISYEAIRFPIMFILQKFLDLSSALSKANSSASIGRYLKHLDITVRPHSGIPMACVSELLQETPNLLTFFANMDRNLTDPIPLFNLLPSRLTHLHIQEYGYNPERWTISLSDLLDFLNSHPNLSSISLPFKFAPDSDPSRIAQNRSWSSIRKWTFQDSSQIVTLVSQLPSGALPNLTEAEFGNGLATHLPCSLHDIRLFLAAHGKSLVSVCLYQADGESMLKLSQTLRSINRLCLHIAEINVAFVGYFPPFELPRSLTTGQFRMPRIVSLGIWFSYDFLEDRIHVQQYHRAVASPWPELFPNLTRIRLLEEQDVDVYRAHDQLTRQGLLNPFRRATCLVVVEDISGTVLGELTKGICTLVDR